MKLKGENTMKTTIHITEKPMAKCGAYSLGNIMIVKEIPVDLIQDRARRLNRNKVTN